VRSAVRKISQQLGPRDKHVMWLAAGTGDPSRDDHIPIVTERAAERVARSDPWWTLLPGHPPFGYRIAGQRHPDTLSAVEIARQVRVNTDFSSS